MTDRQRSANAYNAVVPFILFSNRTFHEPA